MRFSAISARLFSINDTIIDHRPGDNALLLRSGFRLADRMKWNPSWKAPGSVVIDNKGFMMTWYQDGFDEPDDHRLRIQ